MKTFDVGDEMAGTAHCAVCEKRIRGAGRYARIEAGNRMVALCCPFPYNRRIEFYEGD